MVQLGRYAALSAGSALVIIIHAFRSREQFYPAMLYLATSKISLVLLLNMALVLMCILWQAVKTVFLGNLREAEVERLNEQSWREVMEILFAMTIFREEFNVTFVAMITVLLFIKAFHWLSQKRVEYIETTPSVSRLSHFRIITFMALLLALDVLFLQFSAAHILRTRKASVSLFFAFEYLILATSTVATFLKYVLYVGDMVMEGQWDNKAVYIFYLELVRDLLHLSLYLFFFLVIFIHYGLPLHLVRELYETFRNFKARVADFIRYRKITSNMNDRFPDATEEELGRSDATCIICREEMSAAKKLPCGHFFHVHCLRSWLERQQTCPTCRAPVSAPETAPANAAEAPAAHQHGHQQDQRPAEGQGGAPERRPFQGPVLGQWPGAGSFHMRYMQAGVAPNNQARPAAATTGFAVQPGTIAWCPVYIPMIPQGHMLVVGGAPQAGQAGATSEPASENGTTDSEASNSNQQRQSAQRFNSPVQYCQMYMPGFVPLPSYAQPQAQPEVEASPATAADPEPSTRTTSNPSSLLQIQRNQVKQFIEMTHRQLQSLQLLDRQLDSITPEMAESRSSPSQEEANLETTSTSVDVKGKSPVDGIKDEDDDTRELSTGETPRIHDLASLLTLKEQGMVTSSPPSVVPEDESEITQRDSDDSDDGRRPGHHEIS